MSLRQKVIDYFIEHGNASPDDLAKALGVKKSSIYLAVYDINHKKKDNQYSIKFVGSEYKFNICKKIEKQKVETHVTVPVVQRDRTSIGLSNSFLKKVILLSEPDKTDALDMLKKSYFYKKSAEALVEANEVVESLRESLNI